MGKLIDSEKLLEVLACINPTEQWIHWDDIVDVVNDLPSAEPQERKGKWIRVDNLHMRCNHCDVIHLIAQYPRGNIDYCPNCGFKMEVEHE